jgi:hypothetical protein
MHTLTPGWVDVDVYGWTLKTDDYETHCNTDIDTDTLADDLEAQAWADQIIGVPQTWQRISEGPRYGWYHFKAEAS